jgi:cytochrome c553
MRFLLSFLPMRIGFNTGRQPMKVIQSMLMGAAVAAMALPVWAAGDAAAGQQKAGMCVGCHGADGKGVGDNPAIAGADAASVADALRAFKAGERNNPAKQALLGSLSDADIDDVAAYVATLE